MTENTKKSTIESIDEAAASAAESTSTRPSLAPPVDIYENAAGYLVFADLPGVEGEAIDVRYEDGELRLSARRELASPGDAVAAEFRALDFRRVFKIPEDVDAAAIDAEFEDGVLQLRLPKAKAIQPRKITVRASA
ncbi:MAG: Hsp20/alpha crystallin family protein [Nannocystaceae bacterium]